ncbi:flagellar hook capping FlgD N-terminal domain-containing protein [Actinoplanes oblitus]|uniref:Flagellar hook capping FlgD N-terminal domain-containing protein n=1 Tax=Actinoplanes oblitus TaxID=3040509 RepID=A0ABY8WIC3_9ACTN|nr:flagellar hook capping FlgD N-terminal domain-containing protein [Actinoplanes oblitus]WIM96104.1 flagellar hook capping FlgD N-terminal domain-containing protein [Actinoplanes oblitus]
MTTSGIGGSGASSDAAQAAAAAQKAEATKQASSKKDLGDKDTFMKLLVAQLKYQDPSNPADSTQFLAQTAQFTQVEKLEDMISMMKGQRMMNASALVGKTVTYMDPTGQYQTGVVSAAKLNGDSEPTLKVGNTDVELSKVTEIQQTA